MGKQILKNKVNYLGIATQWHLNVWDLNSLSPVPMYLNIKLYYYSSHPLGNQRMPALSILGSSGNKLWNSESPTWVQILSLLLNILCDLR